MASDEKWYFTKEQLENTPTRRCGCPAEKELSYRQQAAKFIQDMGQRLSVTQLCINTAIVYMHRFYVFHSFTHFPWFSIAAAALFLAAKVEEQPRKLEHVIRMSNSCRHSSEKTLDPQSDQYMALSQDLVFNENVLLQTLGFDVAIDHPHTHVVKCCHLVRASKDLAQTSYFMASNTLHLTTMCLQYKPTVVACFCIHLSCKWSNWEIPLSNEQREWFYYVDKSVTTELLEQVTAEFLAIYEKYPTRLKNRINQGQQSGLANSGFDIDKKFLDVKDGGTHGHAKSHHGDPRAGPSNQEEMHKRTSRPQPRPQDINSEQEKYRQKKERDRIASSHQKPLIAQTPFNKHLAMHNSNHHRPSTEPSKVKPQQKASSSSSNHGLAPPSSGSNRPRDASNNATREWDTVGPWLDSNPPPVSRELGKDMRSKDSASVPRQCADSKSGGDGGANVRPVHATDKQTDISRSRPPTDEKLQSKHDPNRARRDDTKSQFSKLPESDNKRHTVNSVQDSKSSAFLPKPNNATSQRLKSPYGDASKSSVPTSQTIKSESRNGNLSLPSFEESSSRIARSEEARLVTPPPTSIKKPSLFSPEQTTPPKRPKASKSPPSAGQRLTNTPQIPTSTGLPPIVSPFNATPTPKSTPINNSRRNRTSSSGSEPELRPVVKKLDQMSGYENILRDSKMAIKLPKVPDIIQPIADIKQEFSPPSFLSAMKPPDLITPFNSTSSQIDIKPTLPIGNGIETNPAMISTLLKEAPTVPHLPVTAAAVAAPQAPAPALKTEHHHKSEKKKKKEKHKHKDKSKSKEDKEKKKKHKDKDREKHKTKEEKGEEPPTTTAPIKITIPKDKITTPDTPGLKIKIPRDKLKTDNISDSVSGNASSGSNLLKIKITKDQISSFSGESRKRDRDKTSMAIAGPPAKASKLNYSRSNEMSQNGRNSYSKVAQGDGDSSLHRLAESKYLSKAPPPQ